MRRLILAVIFTLVGSTAAVAQPIFPSPFRRDAITGDWVESGSDMRIEDGLSVGQTNTSTAKLDIGAATSSTASARIRTGTTPSSPNTGDIYFDGTDIFIYDGSSFVDLTSQGITDHGALSGLTDDDHTIYALLAGRSGGQVVTGGTGASDDLTLRSTTNATKGDLILLDQGGNVIIGGAATASNLRLLEPSGSGTNYTQFVAQAQAGDITYTLPPDDGDAGEQLQTDGSGSLTWESAGVSDHGLLSGLADDDHTQYALLGGRSSGQTLIGGTASGEDLTLQSTSNATRGHIFFGSAQASGFDEVNGRLGIGTASPQLPLHVNGSSAGSGLIAARISNTNSGDAGFQFNLGATPISWFIGGDGSDSSFKIANQIGSGAGPDNGAIITLTTGDLVGIGAGAVTPGAQLEIDVGASTAQTGLLIDANDADQIAFQIDAEQTTADIIDISAATLTTGRALDIPDLNALTTGTGLNIVSNSSNTSERYLVNIVNDNTSADATIPLRVLTDGTGPIAQFEAGSGNNNEEPIIRIKRTDTEIVAGNKLGRIEFAGDDGAANQVGAQIEARAGGVWAANDYPTQLLFYITNDNASSVSEAMRIDEAGVGISNSSPSAFLHIGDTSNSLGGTAGDEIQMLWLQSSTANTDVLEFTTQRLSTGTDWHTAAHRLQRRVDSSDMGYIQLGSWNAGEDLITFGENTTEYMRIDGSGNVIIGNTSAGAKLEVDIGSADAVTGLLIDADDADQIAFQIDAEQTTADVIDINADPLKTGYVIDITADGLTTGRILNLISDSADVSGRSLAVIHNDNALATGATVLTLQQDSNGDMVQGYDGGAVDFRIDDEGVVSSTNHATTLAAAATTFAANSNVMTLTGDGGGNTVATITGASSGTLLTIIFTGTNITITDTDAHTANTVDLAGTATDFTSADDTVLQIVFDGVSWYEVSRSAN